MEAIAREAQIAKPTLYGYFADKEAVYGAILRDLFLEIRAAFAAGIASGDDVVERIAAGIAAKYKVINRLLATSPHAAELYDEQARSPAGRDVTGLDGDVESEVTRLLAAAGVARPRPLAQLILAASFGIARKAQSPAEIGPAIRLLVERLVRPEL